MHRLCQPLDGVFDVGWTWSWEVRGGVFTYSGGSGPLKARSCCFILGACVCVSIDLACEG